MKNHTLAICILILLQTTSSYAFLVDNKTKCDRIHHGELVEVTPYEESKWLGEHDDLAQSACRLWVPMENGKWSFNTAVRIAPDLIMTSAHTLKGIKSDATLLPRSEMMIDGKIRVSNIAHISDIHICDGYTNDKSDSDILRDLAIIKLVTRASGKSFPIFSATPPADLVTSDPILESTCVSAARIWENGGETKPETCRHVCTPHIKLHTKGYFVEESKTPPASALIPNKMNAAGTYQFSQFYYAYPTHAFLKGILIPGDSGGPLFSSPSSGEYELIGLSSQRYLCESYNQASHSINPNKTLDCRWTPLMPQLPWIKKILEENDALQYHPEIQ